jgi:hypothetical protein
VSENTVYEFEMPGENVIIDAVFSSLPSNKYSVSTGSYGNGTVIPNKASASAGDTIILAITPEEGYELIESSLQYYYDSAGHATNKLETNKYQFTMPSSHVTILAEFRPVAYSITVNPGTNGTLVPSAAEAPSGTVITVAVNPNNGYMLKSGTLKYNDGSNHAINEATRQFTMPAHNVVITAEFVSVPAGTYVVSVGDITGSGSLQASPWTGTEGTTITITALPEPGWRLKAGSLAYNDGADHVINETSRTFTMPAADVTLTAEFERIPLTITGYDGSHGAVSAGAGPYYVGDTVTVTVSPDSGYRLKSGSLAYNDGADHVINETSKTFTMPANNVTLKAEFEAALYNVAGLTAAGGSVTVSKDNQNFGENITATVGAAIYVKTAANPGYTISSLAWDDGTSHELSGAGPAYSFTMPAGDVELTAVFAKIPYAITVSPSANGTVAITNPKANYYVDDAISLTITPADGYKLQSLAYNDGSSHPISGVSFIMPASNITITAAFTQLGVGEKTAAMLVQEGHDALLIKDWDTAAARYEEAWNKDSSYTPAILYSTLAKLASIPKDSAVSALMKNRLGLSQWPSTLNGLFSDDWFDDSYANQMEYEYYDSDYRQWVWWNSYEPGTYDPNTGTYSGEPGYYVWLVDYTLVTSEPHMEPVTWYYEWDDDTETESGYRWFTEGETWSGYGELPGGETYTIEQTGYHLVEYYDKSQGWVYVMPQWVPGERRMERAYSYWAEDKGEWAYWCEPSYYPVDVAGYYTRSNERYELVSTTPIPNTFSQPPLLIPTWFEDTDTYKNSLNTIGGNIYKTGKTWSLLVFANLVDKNTNGLNDILDAVISSAFGSAFTDAETRAASLGDALVRIDEEIMIAFGLDRIFEGDQLDIGGAELKLLFSALKVYKAGLEWLGAYDWNTNLNFLKNKDWIHLAEDPSQVTIAADGLPLRNNFLKARNNTYMADSKNDFISALDSAISAYDSITARSSLPPAASDFFAEYAGIKSALQALRTSINSGTVFYVNDISGAVYSNSQAGSKLGIDMGKLFTPGQLALDKLVETENDQGSTPVFYGFTWEDDFRDGTAIATKTQIGTYSGLGFKFKLTPLKEIIVQGVFDDMPDTLEQCVVSDWGVGDAYQNFKRGAERFWDLYHQ